MLPLLPNTWYHAALVRSGSSGNWTARLYLNGQEDATAVATGLGPNSVSNKTSIGRLGDANSSYFDGLIDDVRIYNYALTPTEITALYNSSIAAGDIIYNQDHHVMQFYDGALWRAMGPQPGAGGGGCSGPAGAEGDLLHNQDQHVMQYCDGAVWRLIGHKPADVTSSLVGWWKLDENAGTTAADSSSGGNNGTLTNGPVWQPTGGQVNGALQFDGSNDYVGLGTQAAFDLTAQMTVSAWIKMQDTTHRSIVNNVDSSSTGRWNFEVNRTAGKFGFNWDNAVVVTSNTALSTNTWYHVAAIRSGSTGNWTATLYLNGVADNSATTAINPNGSNGNVYIGSVLGSYFFNGLIDDVRIYNRALSAQEIADVYLAGGGT